MSNPKNLGSPSASGVGSDHSRIPSAGEDLAEKHLLALELWDQPKEVIAKRSKAVVSGQYIEGFFTKLNKINQDHVSSLEKFIQPYMKEFESKLSGEGPSIKLAWSAVISAVDDKVRELSNCLRGMAGALEAVKLISGEKDYQDKVKDILAELTVAEQNKQKKDTEFAKANKQYLELKEEIVTDLMRKGLPCDGDEWLKHVDAYRKLKRRNSVTDKKMAEVGHAMVSKVYSDCVTKSLDSFQNLEFRRIENIEFLLSALTNLEGQNLTSVLNMSVKAQRASRNINKQDDLREFCRKNASGKPCPWLELEIVELNGPDSPDKGQKTAMAKVTVSNPFSRANQANLQWRGGIAHAAQAGAAISTLQQNNTKPDRPIASNRPIVAAGVRSTGIAYRPTITSKAVAKVDVPVDKTKGEGVPASDNLKSTPISTSTAAPVTAVATETNAAADDEYVDFMTTTPIVIDNGSCTIKAGFAGARSPSLSVPSVSVTYPSLNKLLINSTDSHLVGGASQHVASGVYELLESLGDTAYEFLAVNGSVFQDNVDANTSADLFRMWDYLFTQLDARPDQHRVLLTMPILAPTALRKIVYETMYEQFNVPAVHIAPAPLLTAYAAGSTTGLVVDVGHSSCQVLPVVDGYILSAHMRRARHLGGRGQTERIVDYFRKTSANMEVGKNGYATQCHLFDMARNIKDRLAYCARSSREYQDELMLLGRVEPLLSEGQTKGPSNKQLYNPIAVQRELLNCGEVFFSPKDVLGDRDDSFLSVPELVKDVVMRCDVDTRRSLLGNVLLCGGVSAMPGLQNRLQSELKHAIPQMTTRVFCSEESRYSAWCGGSVLATLPSFQESWLSLQDYNERGAPDQ